MTPAATFSDLLVEMPDGALLLNEGVHPMPNLLAMDAEEVLKAFKSSQQRDFSVVIDQLEAPDNPLNKMLNELRAIAEKEPGNRFKDL